MIPIDPATILHVLPKPGGREAVLLRAVPDLAGPRIEVTLAQVVPDRGYHAIRSIGIGPTIREGFVNAVGRLRTPEPADSAAPAPLAGATASTIVPAKVRT